MACLGSVLYDPAAVATKTTASLSAMSAFDTTNARISFTAPANGIVLVKIRVSGKGAANNPQVLLGVLESTTVRGRQAPIKPPRGLPAAASLVPNEATFPITGLTPGNSYTFDAAMSVETLLAATQMGWGGPNNATTSDAYGALSFEIWETGNLLGAKMYDPAVAVTKSTAALLAMTALDTTNLRIAFTVPASGRVAVRLRCVVNGATSLPTIYLGVLDGSTVMMRQAGWTDAASIGGVVATDLCTTETFAVVGGLTPAASLTWDAAYGVETIVASTALKYGGPDNATANDAFGGFLYEIWEA